MLWSLPETLQISATPDEKRSFHVLLTQARINSIALAAAIHCRQPGGGYPATSVDLVLPESQLPSKWAACSLERDLLQDAWDRPIFYMAEEGRLLIVSAGPDGRFATEDDIGLPHSDDQHAEQMNLDSECATSPSVGPLR